MLKVTNLTIAYGNQVAVRDVSVHVEQGETVAIVGPNGAGKSTVINGIAGMAPPLEGSIKLEGRELCGASPERIARLGISLVPEGRRIWPTLTVAEHLTLGAMNRGRGDASKVAVESIFERLPGLSDLADRTAGSLSGGEQQQVAIGRALVGAPRLLLLDEMSLGLAPTVIDYLFKLLEELREDGLTIVIVEQHTTRAIKFSDRTYGLKRGRVVIDRPSSELLDQRDLLDTYLG